MFTKEEMEVLDQIANDWFGCEYNELDAEDQDDIYCYAEENIF